MNVEQKELPQPGGAGGGAGGCCAEGLAVPCGAEDPR